MILQLLLTEICFPHFLFFPLRTQWKMNSAFMSIA